MKKSELFEIAIKIIGLTLLPAFIRTFGQVISMIPMLYGSPFGSMFSSGQFIVTAILIVISYILPIYLFLFQSKWITGLVFKHSHEEEDIQLPFSRSNIIELACLLTGGITLVSGIPGLFSEGGTINSLNNLAIPGWQVTGNYLMPEIISLIISVLLIIFSKKIASFFSKEKALVNSEISSPEDEL